MRLLTVLFPLACLLSLGANANHSVRCHTLKKCTALKQPLEVRLKQVEKEVMELSPVPFIGDIERDSSGKVLRMNQYNAEKHCKAKGSRLPTVREYAQLSQLMGARGIRESAYKNLIGDLIETAKVSNEIDAMEADGFHTIYTRNNRYRVLEFYFDHSGYRYRRPKDDDVDEWGWGFWTSSVTGVSSEFYAFDGYHGDFVRDYRRYYHSIRCMARH